MADSIRIRATGILVRDDCVLMIENYDDQVGLYYNLPGGGVVFGEAVHEALKRELFEEIGLAVKVGRLLLTFEMRHGWIRDTIAPFHGIGLGLLCHTSEDAQPVFPLSQTPSRPGLPGCRSMICRMCHCCQKLVCRCGRRFGMNRTLRPFVWSMNSICCER